MAFTVYGKIADLDVSYKWDDGKLSGDQFLVDMLLATNHAAVPTPGPPPMTFTGDRLEGELSAFWFIKQQLTEISSVEGNIPYPESLPENVIE